MVNDLKHLLRENVADAPVDHVDVHALVGAGRRRVRGRRTAIGGGAALVVAGVVATTALAGPFGADRGLQVTDGPPAPNAPTLHLADAERAVEGRDFEVLASHTNENLDRDNGQYFDGVTDDGLLLFRDGPRAEQLYPRFALMDPATGAKDWLPDPDLGQQQVWPIELGTDRLVLLSADGGMKVELAAHVFDRGTRQWSEMTWPALPAVERVLGVLGPDGRLYVSLPATTGQAPEGGWPTGPDGEADDADAEGDTYQLWSVSLTDGSDVRDEVLSVGEVVFTESSMVWTDARNGAAGLVHVRDLATGLEHSFDPDAGERCNLLDFGATDDRVMLSQYCGTYAEGGRDDRVQILTTDGDQVVTLQGNGIDGSLAGPGENNLVAVTSYEEKRSGTYVYDLATDRFLRVSDAVSSWGMGGSGSRWSVPVGHPDQPGPRRHPVAGPPAPLTCTEPAPVPKNWRRLGGWNEGATISDRGRARVRRRRGLPLLRASRRSASRS